MKRIQASKNMPDSERTFVCEHCSKTIRIPYNLPPTTAPCPNCGQKVTSPPPPAEAKAESETTAEPRPISGRSVESNRWLLPAGAAAALLALAFSLLFVSLNKKGDEAKVLPTLEESEKSGNESAPPPLQPEALREEAERVLRNFQATSDVASRANFVIGGDEIRPEMEEFYAQYPLGEEDCPHEAFGAVPLSRNDFMRGFYLMAYDRPEQFEMSEFFRPIVPLSVQYGLEEPDLVLKTEADLENFVAPALRILAFFRSTEKGMKLDWHVYVQTKHRLLHRFVQQPEPGRKGDFRVVVSQDLDARERAGETVYRLADPANYSDYAKIAVNDESELGRVLSVLKWRGKALSGFPVRNATVRLAWSEEEQPEMRLDSFLCWEFLNLGGELGNWKGEENP
ncbi:MAG: hypothetical protein Q7Q71_07440 [Verrucomicrobiota bacterium JB023]|nr:hypothetical protein [Verrucomicrobiota bacterium JB023]